MAVELLKYQEKLNAVHVPFRGAAPALQALVAGDVHFITDAVSTVAQSVKTGKARGLAVTSPLQSSVFPELPTMREAGFPDYQTGLWNMIMVPKGTPSIAVSKLHSAIQRVLQDSSTRERLAKPGVTTVEASGSDSSKKFLETEMTRWADVIRAGDIQPG